ncbi:hypothetical protein EXIGLDRAFT_374022 [Exidia glandulosa HHB12029]|uniref:Uncharacterized protein n=1 Tax=Exidia glandulosa HHB12029 TaxID=1314781 RepID=A0A165PYC7_EXIGL|nr:hypothetical protein EXIGLDRAFT_374022 [Exidia glandulosa HHB12029]
MRLVFGSPPAAFALPCSTYRTLVLATSNRILHLFMLMIQLRCILCSSSLLLHCCLSSSSCSLYHCLLPLLDSDLAPVRYFVCLRFRFRLLILSHSFGLLGIGVARWRPGCSVPASSSISFLSLSLVASSLRACYCYCMYSSALCSTLLALYMSPPALLCCPFYFTPTCRLAV